MQQSDNRVCLKELCLLTLVSAGRLCAAELAVGLLSQFCSALSLPTVNQWEFAWGKNKQTPSIWPFNIFALSFCWMLSKVNLLKGFWKDASSSQLCLSNMDNLHQFCALGFSLQPAFIGVLTACKFSLCCSACKLTLCLGLAVNELLSAWCRYWAFALKQTPERTDFLRTDNWGG